MAGPAAATATKAALAETSSGGTDAFSSVHLPGNEDPTGAVAVAAPAVTEPAEPAAIEAVAQTPEAETPGAEPPETPAAKPAEPAASKLWAERFKTPEELEVAYSHSSKEGKRLATTVKEQEAAHDKTVGELRDKIAELEILAEAGPEIKEPTDEELEALGPVKATRLLQRLSDRKTLLHSLKGRKEQRERDAKSEVGALKGHIDGQIDAMLADAQRFPDYGVLQPDMTMIMDAEPGVTGHPNSPQIVYLAAYGRRALKRDGEARTKTKESEDAAKAKAKAAAVGAGAAGATGGGAKEPAKPSDQDLDSDEAFNASFNKHAASRNLTW